MESAPASPVIRRGFTLVEMVVVLAIIVIITTIALLGQSSFNRSLVLTDISYTIAFSIREAQSYGISSRRAGSTSNAGYGVHFTSASPSAYTLFSDTVPVRPGDVSNPSTCPGHPNVSSANPESKPGNCIQDTSAETMRSYALNNGFRIKSFCGTRVSNGQEVCSDSGIVALDILYMRPNTQSIITGITSSAVPPSLASRVPLSSATIRVASPDGVAERCVLVTKVGHVSVAQKGDAGCP